jgi:S1-C subfamily serine protease
MIMGCRSITGLLAAFAAATMCGCRSPQNPSDEVRHASYIRCQILFTWNNEAAKRWTYILFSGGPQFTATMDAQTGAVNWVAGKKAFSTGLAIGFEPDGYLVTAAHALNTNIFVLGWFDGKMDLKPARVVFKRNSNTHADLALIKTDGELDHCSILGERPRSGDRAFAVVCYRNNTHLAIDFAGGTVLGMARDPLGGPLDLIKTDVPLGHGDSGGPLLSSGGQLIGVNSGISFTLGKHWSDSFYPDRELIQRLVEEDRSSRAPKVTGANTGGPRQLPMRTRWAANVAQF